MNEVISIKLIRPNFAGLSVKDRNLLIQQIAQDIAQQIARQEDERVRQEEITYWQNKFLGWQLQDLIAEQQHAEIKRRSSE